MRQILKSWIVNASANNTARTNCLPQHRYLIVYYWEHNCRRYIKYSLYKEKTKISENSILRSLTK